jgi:hypothetical protein
MSELRIKKESELRERTAAFTLFTSNLTRALSLGTKVQHLQQNRSYYHLQYVHAIWYHSWL